MSCTMSYFSSIFIRHHMFVVIPCSFKIYQNTKKLLLFLSVLYEHSQDGNGICVTIPWHDYEFSAIDNGYTTLISVFVLLLSIVALRHLDRQVQLTFDIDLKLVLSAQSIGGQSTARS